VHVQKLENEFVNGYRDGDQALYVSIYNDKELDNTLDVSNEMINSWSPFWKDANARFESMLIRDPDLAHMSGKMFFVWEGNHT